MLQSINKTDPVTLRILQVTQTLFVEHGAENVNMYKIAKAAAIGQASLYRRFKDIDEIIFAIIGNHFAILQDEVAAFNLQQDKTSIDKIKHFFSCYIDFLEKGYEYFGDLPPKKIPKQGFNATPMYKYLFDTLYELLIDHGLSAKANISVNFTAHTLLSILFVPNYVILRSENYSVDVIKQHFFNTYVESL